jgi:hypothetical protein
MKSKRKGINILALAHSPYPFSPHPGLLPIWGKENFEPTGFLVGTLSGP